MSRWGSRGRGRLVAILLVALVVSGILAYLVAPYLMALLTPPGTWLRPYKVHIGSFDNSYLALAAPISYARSFSCDLNPNKDIYVVNVKPSWVMSDQWVYKMDDKGFAFIFDYQDNVDCAPNLGIVATARPPVEDPRTGIAEITYDVYIIIGSDPWLGAVASMESGIAPKNSYFVLRLWPPHPVLDFTLDGRREEYYYTQDGSVEFILDIPSKIPQAIPITGPILESLKRYGIWGLLWLDDTATTFHRVMTVRVRTAAIVTSATATLLHTFQDQGGFVTMYPRTVTTATYTGLVPVTTTRTVTSFQVFSFFTTTVQGQTLTTQIPVYTTVYNTQTFTYTGLRTIERTVTVTTPTTITVYSEATQKAVDTVVEEIIREIAKTPLWIWIVVAVLFAFIVVLMVMTATAVRAGRQRYSRRGRR